MIRRPPRSTLFPLHDALPILGGAGTRTRCRPGTRRAVSRDTHGRSWPNPMRVTRAWVKNEGAMPRQIRSEEHTSELQSRQYLVCRLLLEKKKTILMIRFSAQI